MLENVRNVRNLAFIGLNAHKNPRKNNGRKNKNVEPRGIGDALVEVEKTLHYGGVNHNLPT